MKERMEYAQEIVRRRIAAAPDAITRIRWMVLQKLLAEGSSFDKVGQIVDEGGNLFVYIVGDRFCAEVESGGCILPHIFVDRSRGGRELAGYIRKKLDQSAVFIEELTKLYPDDVIQAVVRCEG